MPPLSLVDIIAFAVISLGALHGYWRGLTVELSRVVSVAVALVSAILMLDPLGAWLAGHTRLAAPQARAVAFGAAAAAAFAVMILARYLLRRILKIIVEPRADKLGGLIAGTVRSSIYVLIAFALLNLWPHDYLNRVFGEESVVGTVVLRCLPVVREELTKARDAAASAVEKATGAADTAPRADQQDPDPVRSRRRP
jgi:uncharacterized membrane protein required for colicin V production